MLIAEEKWELYYKKAVALLNDNRLVWDEFIEATRILKLSCHKDAVEHLKILREGVSNPEFTRCLYWKFVSSYISYQIVCGKRILANLLTILFVCAN